MNTQLFSGIYFGAVPYESVTLHGTGDYDVLSDTSIDSFRYSNYVLVIYVSLSIFIATL